MRKAKLTITIDPSIIKAAKDKLRILPKQSLSAWIEKILFNEFVKPK